MKGVIRIIGYLLLVAFVGTAKSEPENATLVFAADMPVIGNAATGDYPELGTLLKEQRARDPNTFFVFGGGSIGPSPMSGFDRGSHIIDILNSLEPDLMGVTKREFSYFEDELSLRSYEAAFPIIASNIYDKMLEENLNGLTDGVIIEKGPFKLGFVSILHDTVIKEYLLNRISMLDPERAILDTAEKLRLQGADYIILLYSNAFDFIEEMLRNSTIDMALLTDPHLELTQTRHIPQHPNSVYLTKPGQVAVVKLEFDKSSSKLKAEWEALSLNQFERAPVIELQVQQYLLRLNRLLNEEIGVLNSELDTTRPVVRGQESAFGNFVADSIREFFRADIGLINGGVIRGEKNYFPGTPISRRDIAVELPFRSRVVVMNVQGKDLRQALENGLGLVEDLKGRFPQVSGLQISYNIKAPPGSRIQSIKIHGQELGEDTSYRLATSDYLANGGDGYDALRNGTQLDSGPHVTPLLSEIVINSIRNKNQIAPRIEGRIVNVDG